MKLLYLSDTCSAPSHYGVDKKIAGQTKAFENYGYDVYHAKYYTDGNEKYWLGIWKDEKCLAKTKMCERSLIKILQSVKAGKFIARFCSENNIFAIYARAPYTLILFFIKYFSKKIFIYMEVPTFPFYQEFSHDIKSQINLCIIKCIGFTHRFSVSKIITYSDHKKIYNMPCINISNGIDFNGTQMVTKESHEGIVFTVVSSVARWHGIDRFLKSLAAYRKPGVKFNIVGTGPAIPELKNIADHDEYLKKVVVFHGFKSGKELDDIYNETDIAIGSLGCHRIGLMLVHSLKNREYCSAGIPIIYSGIDQILDQADFTYNISPDEALLNIDDIISWYKRLNMTPEKIRKFAYEHLTWEKQLEPVIKSLRLATDSTDKREDVTTNPH